MNATEYLAAIGASLITEALTYSVPLDHLPQDRRERFQLFLAVEINGPKAALYFKDRRYPDVTRWWPTPFDKGDVVALVQAIEDVRAALSDKENDWTLPESVAKGQTWPPAWLEKPSEPASSQA